MFLWGKLFFLIERSTLCLMLTTSQLNHVKTQCVLHQIGVIGEEFLKNAYSQRLLVRL